MEAIPDLMVKSHNKIEGFLNELKQAIQQKSELRKEVFNKFRWELQKHIFIEEKAIFDNLDLEDPELANKVTTVLNQHKEFLNKLIDIENDLDSEQDFFEFETLLMHHKNFEDKILYPELDQALSEELKHKIISRIKEVMN